MTILENIIYEILADSDSGREENFERFDLENYGPSENKRNQDIIQIMMFDIRRCAELSAMLHCIQISTNTCEVTM